MFDNYQTIEFKDKKNFICKNRIEYLLSVCPSYVTDYEKYLTSRNSIKTRMEYLQDIYTFFRYLVQKNPKINDTSDVTLLMLEKLNGFDFDDYNIWLSSYKFDPDDAREIEKENSTVTKKRKLTALRSLYHFLYTRDMISCNPSEKIIMPRVARKKRTAIRVLEPKEKRAFLQTIENEIKSAKALEKPEPMAMALRDKAIIYLFLGTGLRVSELCAINCSDISFNLGYINVIRKEDRDEDKTTDRVYLSDDVESALLEYLNSARDVLSPNTDNYDALFISSRHSRITPRAVELLVKKYANRALGTKNDVHPHTLRATFGTEYYQQFKDISATSAAMNHAGIEITAAYYIREDERAKEKVKEMQML